MTKTRFVSLMLAVLMLLAAVPAFAESTIDMGGATITLAYNWDYVPATTDYVYNPETDGPGVLEDLEAMKAIEAKYNCRIVRINLDWNQRVPAITSSVMNGDYLADLILLDQAQILPLAAQDMLVAFNSFVPATDDLFTEKQILTSGGKLMGNDYAVKAVGDSSAGFMLGVNLDLVDELGLENPVDLYENGEWTWEKMKEICIAATKDNDGDGKNDTWGLSGAPYEIAFNLIAANDGYMADLANRKQGLDDPKTMEALNYFNDLYFVEKVAYVAEGGLDDWNGNRGAFLQANSVFYQIQDWLLGNAVEYNFAIVPYPQGPSNESGNNFLWSVSGWTMPKSCPNPEWAYLVLQELTAYKTLEERSQGNIDWLGGMLQTEEDIYRMREIANGKALMDESSGLSNFPNYSMIWAMFNQGKTPAQVVEENKQVAQDSINEFFKAIEE